MKRNDRFSKLIIVHSNDRITFLLFHYDPFIAEWMCDVNVNVDQLESQ